MDGMVTVINDTNVKKNSQPHIKTDIEMKSSLKEMKPVSMICSLDMIQLMTKTKKKW